ncbi:MAG: hypothetical protein Alpg2KO_11460 [Alphaproteobacteria bacterium]
MKYLTLALTATALSFATPALAVDQGQTPQVAVQTAQTAHVSVNGLVCDFCARALEKVFGKQDAVSDIDVDLDSKVITINFKQGQSLDNDTITKLVTDSGYNVEGIHRVE